LADFKPPLLILPQIKKPNWEKKEKLYINLNATSVYECNQDVPSTYEKLQLFSVLSSGGLKRLGAFLSITMGSSFDVRGCFLLLVAPSFVRETKVTRSLFDISLNPLVIGRFCHGDDGESSFELIFSSLGKALISSILHLQYAINGAVIMEACKGGQSVVISTQLVILER